MQYYKCVIVVLSMVFSSKVHGIHIIYYNPLTQGTIMTHTPQKFAEYTYHKPDIIRSVLIPRHNFNYYAYSMGDFSRFGFALAGLPWKCGFIIVQSCTFVPLYWKVDKFEVIWPRNTRGCISGRQALEAGTPSACMIGINTSKQRTSIAYLRPIYN